MLKFLFPRLTAAPAAGAAAYAAASTIARDPNFYRAGGVPDTLDGRFAVLATVLALVMVRLEHEGEEGTALSVALTERFVDMMDAEHRELGLGDPGVGRTVRRLVTSLSRRVDLWRSAVGGAEPWTAAARASLYRGEIADEAVAASAGRLQAIWAGLERQDRESIARGDLG